MRVISGKLGSRLFAAPKGSVTHPMSDRVRSALFNSLGDLSGWTALDPFAGSGALSFEAISRGAKSTIAIEKDRNSFKVLQQNITDLGLSAQIKAIRANCRSWSNHNPEAKFDLILCDPPYNSLDVVLINNLVHHLKPNALMILSYPGKEPVPNVNGVVVVNNRNYGDAALVTYQLKAE